MSANSRPPQSQSVPLWVLWVLFQLVVSLVLVYALLLPGHSRHVAALFFVGMAYVCRRDGWFAAYYVWSIGAVIAFALFISEVVKT